MPFRKQTFDIVNCCGALHNFTDVRKVLKEVKRILKSDGRLASAAGYKKSTLFGDFLGFISDTFFKVHLFSATELLALLEKAGFTARIYHKKNTWMIASGTS